MRNNDMGFEKNSGSQHFRGIVPGNGNPPGDHLWVAYSVNKEDLPGADEKVDPSAFLIDNVKTH